jgi:hypothetical protein
MSITVGWDNNEKTILIYHYEGKWSWAEYNASISQAEQLLAGRTSPVDVIANFSQSTLLPASALSGFKKSMDSRPINFRLAVLVTQGELIPRLVDIFRKVYSKIGDKLVVARTVEEAREIIAKRQNAAPKD